MAMSLASPPTSTSTASPKPEEVKKNPTTTDTTTDDTSNSNTNTVKSEATNNNNNATATTGATTTNGAAPAATAVKRKPSRRANTAERRATHNAVERQRRETLNGRFLDLAALLPNLSQIRRPSKSSIVNSSIAHIHASRRHRLLASRELRLLKAESDALRRELNEWRDRAGLPRVEEPVRSDAFGIVVSGEIDVLVAEMGAEMAAQGHGNIVGLNAQPGIGGLMDVEEDEELDEWAAASGAAQPQGYPASQYDDDVFVPAAPVHHHPHPHAHHPHHHHQHQSSMGPLPPVGMPGMPHHHIQPPIHHPMQQPPPPPPQQQQQQFYPQPQQAQIPFVDDERHHFMKTGGNPFAHNVPGARPAYDGAGALFTPPATRDGLPPNGVAGMANGSGNGAPSSNGGASPAHSVHSAHSVGNNAPSPGSGHGSTPPPMSAVSTQSQFSSARSGSGSPVGGGSGYELASSSGADKRYSGSQQQQQQMMGGMMGFGGGAGEMGAYGGHGGGGYGGGHGHGHGGHHAHGGHGHGHHAGGHHAHHAMVNPVGAGAEGGLFGMML